VLERVRSASTMNDPASLGLESRLTNDRSQAARTATLPTAPPRQACADT